MVDFFSLLPAGLPANPALLPTLLNLLPMGVMYYTPVVDAAGTLTDLALVYLNPAAQRMTQLPAQPGTTYRQQFPTTDENGAWDFHRRTWLSGEPQQFQFYYDADGFDAYFRVAAQRLAGGLLTIFTDTQDEARSQAEQALLASQARERAAHAEAEAERRRFREVLMHLPAQVAVNRGPDHVFALVNAPYQQLFPTRTVQGLPARQALPELEGQQFFEMLDRVYQTGEPFYNRAMPALVDFTNTGRLERRYVDVFFQALHDAQGRVDGILNFSYDVTEQELARQQVQSLNEELAAINKELRASNEEYLVANTALSESQQQLQQLTQALEARVQERTQQLEMALAEAGRQRQSLVELVQQAPAAMCIVKGPDFVYETFNPLYAAMFGGRPQLGRPMREVLPEVVNHPGFLVLRAVYAEGRTTRESEVLVPLARPGDGVLEDHYFSYTQQPRYDPQGQIDGVFVFAVEVTEQVLARRQVERLNQELEARVQERTRQVEAARAEVEGERALLQALFTQAPIAIGLYTGENLHVVAASTLLATWLGQPHAHIVGRPLLESAPELQGQGFDDLLRQVMVTQVPFTGTEMPAVTRRRGGLYTGYYNAVYQPLYAADRQIIGVMSVAVDVTEQVLARRQVEQLNAELETRVRERTADLQESENRFRTMADAAPAMLWVTDPDGQCTYLNAQWYQYTGQSEAEALGMGWTQAVHPDDAQQAGQKFLEANARRANFYIRYRLRRHDGVYRWAVDAGRPHFAEDGAYAGMVGTVIDIHEQQLAEDELHATNKQLMRTNVDLDNFIYTASHDLKAPITNIEGLLLALEHELPATARTGDVPLMLAMMQDAIERFRRTIAHLTDLSRLQKEHSAESDVVPLASVVEAVRLDLGPLLTQGRLTVTIPQGLTVTFAEKNLRSVVYNLLSNAFKYRHPDRAPVVQLRSWLANGYPVLEVQDNGLGLDLSQGQEKLFAMFQRLHTHVEGTGIGLYMVRRILENAGGRIEVTSELGQGSTFRVYFRG